MEVAESGETQLKQLTADKVAKLLPQSMPSEWEYQQIVCLPHSKLPFDWFEKFWKWVHDKSLHYFERQLIVPVQPAGMSSGSFQVVRLNQQSPVVYIPSAVACSPQLLSALSKFKVMCSKETCFPYLSHRQLLDYLNTFNANGILDAINYASASVDLNQVSLSEDEGSNLRNSLFSYNLDYQRLQVLNSLPIYSTLANSNKRLYSTTKAARESVTKQALLEPDKPVLTPKHLPPNLVLFSNNPPQNYMLQLGGLATQNNIDFLLKIIFPLIQRGRYPRNLLDGAMKEVLQSIPVLTRQKEKLRQLLTSLSMLPFLKNSQGHLCCPKDLYDPSNEKIQGLFKGEPVFPVVPFDDEESLYFLRKCGLKQSATPQVIVDIINSISHSQASYPQKVSTIKLARAEAVLSYLESCDMDAYVIIPNSRKLVTFSSALQQLATSRSWLPVCPTPPEKYPSCIEWKGKHFASHFVSMSTCTVILSAQNISSLPLIVGSQVYTVETQLPDETAEILNTSSAPVDHVLQHFKLIIKMHAHISREQINYVVHCIYKFLLQTSCSLNTISESIWLSDQHTFVSPDVVAAKHHPTFLYNLEPYLFILPAELLRYKKLFGIPKHITKVQIISVLERIKRSDPFQLNPGKAWDMVISILNWLTDNGEKAVELSTESIYVPIQSSSATPQLVEADKVIYTENEFLKNIETEASYMFVHSRVHSNLAHCLGLRTLSDSLGITEDVFEDTGQYEPLTVRLKNILRDYKDGLTIIKELLQNADDAEATEVNICYDARTHNVNTKALFFPGMADSHGPALVVHNNAVFSGEDFDNITKLAGATKESKPLKIGKFGIGFCSVYNITDIPSFVSHDTLCIFDPTLSHLKKEVKNHSQSGKKVKLTSKFVARSKQLAPYDGLYGFKLGCVYKGTMFRFPFRTVSSELSHKIYSKADIDELVNGIYKHASKLLLFLHSVERITFSRISQGEQAPTMLLEVTRTPVETTTLLPQINTYTIESSYLSANRFHQQQWLVASSMETVECKHATASVACLLSAQQPTEVEGEVFCFLPLALKTGLPVHISGNFAVINNRRGIWTSDRESKTSFEVKWNEELMSTVVSSAYHLLLSALQIMEEQGQLDNYVFYSLWPVEQKLEVHNPWNILVRILYSHIQSTNLFYCTLTNQWLTIEESKFLDSGILSVSTSNPNTPQCVLEVVKQLQLPIVDLPSDYHSYLDLSDSTITEQDFIKLFFNSILSLDNAIKSRNSVLECLLEVYASELDLFFSERVDFIKEILGSNACVPCSPDGRVLKKCHEVIDCKSPFDELFDPGEKMFPICSFLKKQLVHMALVDLGMINEFIPWRLLLERAHSIPLTFKRDKTKALNRVKIILQCIESTWMHDSDEENYKGLSSIPFLPVMSKPKGYFLSWKGEDHALLCGKELVMRKRGKTEHYMANIVGSQSSILNEHSSKGGCGFLTEINQLILKIRKDPTIEEVTKHLQQLIDLVKTKKTPLDKKFLEFCTECTSDIYDFLDLQTITEFGELKGISCIWTGAKFVEPHLVACDWSLPGPYLYSVPPSMSNKKNLIKALGIKNIFDIHDIINALLAMKNDFHSSPINEKCQRLLKALIPLLQEIDFSDEMKDLDMYLPDSNYVLYLSSELAYGDQSQEDDIKFIHDIIPKKLALDLGVKSFDTRRLDKFDLRKETFFAQSVPFGQREKLTTRIQSILEDYPLDITVLKELLQNADDAKATKMYIILDKRKHDTAKIPSDQWRHLQGPALLVWNDSVFSEDDLKGIQDLGLGGKRAKLESIGQYGIGFNVVYHLTDCPSFITGGDTFCILDPHCCYAPGAEANSPGRMLSISKSFWSRYKGLKSAYLREGLDNCPTDILLKGSLFRFPLRCTSNHIKHSRISLKYSQPMTADRMLRFLRQWMPKMKHELLFLNHIREIQFMVIEEKSCVITTEHSFKSEPDEKGLDSRKTLCAKIASFSNSDNSEPYLVRYTLEITESKPKQKKVKEPECWLLQQGIGNVEYPNWQWAFTERLKPQHGIAAPLSIPEGTKDFQGQVFCFLSLPVKSSLPVHINGKFILNSTRRGLWHATSDDDDDEKSKWNKKLIDSISSSYAHLLCTGKEHYVSSYPMSSLKELAISVKKYYDIFPNWSKGKNVLKAVPEREWLKLANDVYRKIVKQNAPILCSIKVISEKNAKVTQPLGIEEESLLLAVMSEAEAASSEDSKTQKHKKTLMDESKGGAYCVDWYTLIDKECPFAQVFFFDMPLISPPKFPPKYKDIETGKYHSMQLKLILQCIGMNITCAPYRIRKHISESCMAKDDEITAAVICPPETTPTDVYKYYTQFCHQDQPCNISRTPFQNVINFILFISYLLIKSEKDGNKYVIKFLDDPCGHSLLLTADCQLRCFDSKDKILLSDFSVLFPQSLDKFAHPDMKALDVSEEYFHTKEDAYPVICEVVSRKLPKSLKVIHLENASKHISDEELQLLWKCFKDDEAFSTNLSKILQTWALLPAVDNQLFSCTSYSQLLPVIDTAVLMAAKDKKVTSGMETYSFRETEDLLHIQRIFQGLEMPFLTEYASEAKLAGVCPSLKEHGKVLRNLLYVHQRQSISSKLTKGILSDLIQYFKHIPFIANIEYLETLQSLPFFRCIDNSLVPLASHTDVHVWNFYGIPLSGRNKWMKQVQAIFLDNMGEWTELGCSDALKIKYVSEEVIYIAYIFPHFKLLNEVERNDHLKYIRDILYPRMETRNQSAKRSKKGTDVHAKSFIRELEKLPCIADVHGELRSVDAFCDHTEKVFINFTHFQIIPKQFRDSYWKKFLKKIGLKCSVTKSEFKELCKMVASGQHPHTTRASSVLLTYFISQLENEESDWKKDEYFLAEISKIPFLCCAKLPELSWIAPIFNPSHHIRQRGVTLGMTSMSSAAPVELSCLLWTVKPIFKLPDECKCDKKKLLLLQLYSEPSIDDITQNISNISHAPLADFDLFDKYPKYRQPPENSVGLLKVMCENFKLLADTNEVTKDHFDKLSSVPCIPVYSSHQCSDTTVLVKPQLVIATEEAAEYFPFLHKSPDEFMRCAGLKLLNSIGVSTTIELTHLRTVLELVYQKSKQQSLDMNTKKVIQLTIIKFYSLLRDKRRTPAALVAVLKPLYLPSVNNRMFPSTSLLYCDVHDYEGHVDTKTLEEENLSLFHGYYADDNTKDSDFCALIPQELSPKKTSEMCQCTFDKTCQVIADSQSSSATPELVEADKVVYTDNDFLKNVETEDSYTLVHSKVHLKLAHCLGLRTLSKYLGIEEDIFQDAGQYEPLTVRLKNILKDYKDGLTIIKELLQNADDAEATEVNICYDARTHNVNTKALFFPGMADSHGPALVVHNNAVFSCEDFNNITKLAGATKESKPLKIGKFGVGFCSVYHITDIPSFVSNNTLFIFDPTLSYLKKEIKNPAQPGKKVKLASKFVSASKQLAPYDGLYGFKPGATYNGTMFRFPFRTSASELSGTIYSDAVIDELVSSIYKHASKLLLFLCSVEKITFSRISQGEQTPTMLLEVTRTPVETTTLLPQIISHAIESNDLSKNRSYQEQWLVASSMETVECKSATASVACLLSAQQPTEVEGEVFCFLPLALKTGLPVHISGNFAVINSRKGIWTSDGESKTSFEVQWNEELMSTVVPSAYHLLLSALQIMEEQEELDKYVFYSLWPVERKLKIHNPWNILVKGLYSHIQSTNLFYSISTNQWLTIEESKFLESGILSVSSSNPNTPQCVLEVVKQLRLPIVDLPSDYHSYLDLSDSKVSEEDFIKCFFDSMYSFDNAIEARNSVLECLLEVYASELDYWFYERADFIQEILSSNACVPCTPDGYVLKECQEVIDCKPPFDELFDPSEEMFPIPGFLKKPLVHIALINLGMINEFIPWRLLLERAHSIPLTFKRDKTKALNRVKIILQCMESTWMHNSDEENYTELSSIPFLPVMPKPKGYFLSWKGEGHALLCGQEMVMHRRDKAENYMANIAGSQISILNEHSSEGGCGLLIETNQIVLQIRKEPTVEEVTEHLQQLINLVKILPDQKKCDFCTECTLHIYDFLDLLPATKLSELKSIPCIWTGAKFVEPHQVAHNWSFPGPYLYSIPPSMINKHNLIDALEIKNVFDVNDIINALQAMKNDFYNSPVNEKCQLFLKALVPLLQEINFSDEPKDLDIYLPDSNYVLYLSSELAYGDQSHEGDIKFVHDIIPRKLALDLGVRSFDIKRLDKFDSRKETFFAQSVPFGQREKLTTRIQSILEDYPLDITVLKELLQNADDAKATKMYIILDKRKHDTERNGIPSDQWKHLQGPALLVWNDSVFSEDDLEGIQDLGVGGKRKESESIGQYGIGFNVVYHLTDCPSFITGRSIFCILDPHCYYAPGAEAYSPGRRVSIDRSFWSEYKGLKSPYLREGLKNCPPNIQTGSLFRLPLRCTSNHIKHSKIIDSTEPPMTADRMLKLLHQWMPKMKQELLFLIHIREIQFMVIEEKSCFITTEHSFNVVLDEEGLDSRKTLCAKIASFSNSGKSEPYLVRYTLTITESKPKKKKIKEPEHWLLQQGIGDIECPSQQWLFSKRLKPQHGIAAPLSIPEGTKDFQGQVFCFLSLPAKSNFPVHINGKFILNSTRRGLWNATSDDVDEKSKWNMNLLDSISSSYAYLLCAGKEYYVSSHPVNSLKELAISVKKYYSIFPNWFKGTSRAVPEGDWLKVAEDVYRKIMKQNAPILGSIKSIPEKSVKVIQPLSVEEESCLLTIISESEVASSQDSKKLRQKKPLLSNSQIVAYSVEWYTLINEENPLAQVFFFNLPQIVPPKFPPKHQAHDSEIGKTRRRDYSIQLKSILQCIGMNITCAPYRIREYLSKVHKVKDGKSITAVTCPPETTPNAVYRYYTEFYHQDQPCHITRTPFQSVKNFILFISYLLKKSENDSNQYVIKFLDDPCGHSLLLTADCQLRSFKTKDNALLSNFSALFPQSLGKFAHPDMKALDVSKEYFQSKEELVQLFVKLFKKIFLNH